MAFSVFIPSGVFAAGEGKKQVVEEGTGSKYDVVKDKIHGVNVHFIVKEGEKDVHPERIAKAKVRLGQELNKNGQQGDYQANTYEPVGDGSGHLWGYKEYKNFYEWDKDYEIKDEIFWACWGIATYMTRKVTAGAQAIIQSMAGYAGTNIEGTRRKVTMKFWESYSSYYGRWIIDVYSYTYNDGELDDVIIGYGIGEYADMLSDKDEL